MASRIFDDVSRLAGDAASMLTGIKSEVETAVKARLDRTLAELDLVRREEFEAVRAMAIAAREEQDRLAARLAALEGGAKPADSADPAARPKAQPKPKAKPKAEPAVDTMPPPPPVDEPPRG